MRILIAEDDPVSRLLLDATLKKWKYETVVCCDGREALAHLEGDAPPEIAILDWMMPEVDGLDVCRRIRQKSNLIPVYIMMLTAKGQREDIVAGLQAGADDYLTKPFHQQELLARLQVGLRISDLQHKLAARVKELEVALARLNQIQQSQKLEAIGRLASGVAHEINTPIQYIGDNIRFLKDSWQQIQNFLPEKSSDPEIDFIIDEVPRAVDQSMEGVARVTRIVRAMRDFAHPAGKSKVHADINRLIETTVTVSTNEWKYVAELELALDSTLPQIPCLPGELQQVFLNLIVNAGQAIAAAAGEAKTMGKIRIATSMQGNCLEIRISDTGTGIREEYQSRIFDPFFTTKDIGKGTGQGLAIAHSIVVQQHGGNIRFETVPGEGTSFIVELPMEQQEAKEESHEANLVRR